MTTPWHSRSEAQKARNRAAGLERMRRRRQLAQDYKRARGCIVCGWGLNADQYEVEALHFDHLEGHWKVADVSEMYGSSDARFWAEIGKCQVICSRCHAIREARRRTHYPGMQWQEALGSAAEQLRLHHD